MINAALSFPGSTSQVVYTGTNLNNIDPVTILMWVKLNTLVVGLSRWFSKAEAFFFQMASDTGDLNLQHSRATAVAATKTSVVMVANHWYCIVGQLDSTASQVCRVFVGDLSTPVTEPSYASIANGSGTLNDDSASGYCLGNRTTGSRQTAGVIGSTQIVASALSLGVMRDLQYHPRLYGDTRLLTFPGSAGTGRPFDYSRNAYYGTITAAVPTNDVLPSVSRKTV